MQDQGLVEGGSGWLGFRPCIHETAGQGRMCDQVFVNALSAMTPQELTRGLQPWLSGLFLLTGSRLGRHAGWKRMTNITQPVPECFFSRFLFRYAPMGST